MKKCVLLSAKLSVSLNAWEREGVHKGFVRCWGQALWETGPWGSVTEVLLHEKTEKDSSKAMRCWAQAGQRLHIAQACAHLWPWRRVNYIFFLSSSSRRGCLDARSSPLLHACALWSAVPRPQSCRGGLDRCSSLQHLTTQFLNTYLTSGIGTQWSLGQIYRTHCFSKAVQNSVIKSSCIKVNGNHLSKSNSLKQSLHLQYTNVIPAGTVPQLPSESDYLACTEELFPYKSPLLNDATSPKGSDSSTQLT